MPKLKDIVRLEKLLLDASNELKARLTQLAIIHQEQPALIPQLLKQYIDSSKELNTRDKKVLVEYVACLAEKYTRKELTEIGIFSQYSNDVYFSNGLLTASQQYFISYDSVLGSVNPIDKGELASEFNSANLLHHPLLSQAVFHEAMTAILLNFILIPIYCGLFSPQTALTFWQDTMLFETFFILSKARYHEAHCLERKKQAADRLNDVLLAMKNTLTESIAVTNDKNSIKSADVPKIISATSQQVFDENLIISTQKYTSQPRSSIDLTQGNSTPTETDTFEDMSRKSSKRSKPKRNTTPKQSTTGTRSNTRTLQTGHSGQHRFFNGKKYTCIDEGRNTTHKKYLCQDEKIIHETVQNKINLKQLLDVLHYPHVIYQQRGANGLKPLPAANDADYTIKVAKADNHLRFFVTKVHTDSAGDTYYNLTL